MHTMRLQTGRNKGGNVLVYILFYLFYLLNYVFTLFFSLSYTDTMTAEYFNNYVFNTLDKNNLASDLLSTILLSVY